MRAAVFLTSVSDEKKFLSPAKPVVAVAGKSNVGKSSLINFIAGNKKLAKTSQDPGRTRLVNYFDFDAFILADLPGYGYAKAGKTERDKWGALMEAFFRETEIAHTLVLVDSRHLPTEDDKAMIKYLYYYALPFTVVLTKTDKLSKAELKKNTGLIASALSLGVSNLLPTSSEKGWGKDDLLKLLLGKAKEAKVKEKEKE